MTLLITASESLQAMKITTYLELKYLTHGTSGLLEKKGLVYEIGNEGKLTYIYYRRIPSLSTEYTTVVRCQCGFGPGKYPEKQIYPVSPRRAQRAIQPNRICNRVCSISYSELGPPSQLVHYRLYTHQGIH